MLMTSEEVRGAEQAAFTSGVSAEELMEQAGMGIAAIVRQFHPSPGLCTVFCGKGNNAGDALVAARCLADAGWQIDVRLAYAEASLGELAGKKLAALRIGENNKVGVGCHVILDGLLGIGAQGAPREEIAEAIRALNKMRLETGAWVLAIDVPSGLNADDGQPGDPCVRADITATIGFAKAGLIADAATDFVGRLAVVPLEKLSAEYSNRADVVEARHLREWLPPRNFDLYKGRCGHVGIIAGSVGYLGAARLCATAALRAGAGLVTLYVKEQIYPMMATICPPEVMVKTVAHLRDALNDRLDVLAVGPGLFQVETSEVIMMVRDCTIPVIVDAEALNITSRNVRVLLNTRGPRLLTPHPGEMERMVPAKGRTRTKWVEDFIADYPVTLLLKGARTLVGERGNPLSYNTTGSPGMASGGMGDVLTGVAAAVAGQLREKSLYRTAVLSSWLCGRAAERAIFGRGESPESLVASDVIANLGEAFNDLRAGVY